MKTNVWGVLLLSGLLMGCDPPTALRERVSNGAEQPAGDTSQLTLTPETLPHAVAGVRFRQPISAAGAVTPMFWSLEGAEALPWLVVDSEGVLQSSTTPPEVFPEGQPFTLVVRDATGAVGRRAYRLITVCDPAIEVPCFDPDLRRNLCATGSRRCVGARLTACERETTAPGSTRLSACGSACRPCDPTLANACRDGRCACGKGDACEGATRLSVSCCGDNESASCVSLANDTAHCGACGLDCAAPERVGAKANVVPACKDSSCVHACAPDFRSCDQPAPTDVATDFNGCETRIRGQIENCGGCGNNCNTQTAARQNVIPECLGLACSYPCRPGFGDCNGADADGCETRVNTIAHCLQCGRTCAAPEHGIPLCTEQGCDFRCEDGYVRCGAVCVISDRNNCGSCGNVCAPPRFCSAGRCCTCWNDAYTGKRFCSC